MKRFNSNLRHLVSALAVALLAVTAFAQDTGFADELKDYGIAATKYPRPHRFGYGSETPTEIPGAKVVVTKDLISMLASDAKPIVIAAYGAQKTVPGGIVMGGAGEDQLLGLDNEKFINALSVLTSGDKSKPIVFYCHGSKCWLSYNATLHAVELGYSNVFWYRGGRDAWKAANQKFSTPAGSW
jgi:PQQ-dependent catabolism-associated CXXCW motif protein